MTNKERRKNRRFTVPAQTIAITPKNLGQLIDISSEGCAIRYIGDEICLDADEYIDILMKKSKDDKCYLERFPINIVWQQLPDFSAFSTIIVKKVGIKFKNLTSLQKQQLQRFIENYGIAEV